MYDEANASIISNGKIEGVVESYAHDTSSTSAVNAENGVVTGGITAGAQNGSINTEWGYAGSVDNGDAPFTNNGSYNTEYNLDINSGYYPGDENYEGIDENESSSASFVNNGDISADNMNAVLFANGSVTIQNNENGAIITGTNPGNEGEGMSVGNAGNGEGVVSLENAGEITGEYINIWIEKDGEIVPIEGEAAAEETPAA